MSRYPTTESEQLAERLQEMLAEAWPRRMTSTELTEFAGMRHATWGWCSGDVGHCYALGGIGSRSIFNATHHLPTDYRRYVNKDGVVFGWDEFEVPVSLQQVNPALNKLHKRGLVLKEKPKSGSRSCLWAALDQEQYVLAEAEAMDILRQTVERTRQREEREAAERERERDEKLEALLHPVHRARKRVREAAEREPASEPEPEPEAVEPEPVVERPNIVYC